MFEEKEYIVGSEYRIGKILARDSKSRDYMIALGLIPGEMIKIVKSMFWGRYWVIQVRRQLIGLRLSELQRLQLHDIHH